MKDGTPNLLMLHGILMSSLELRFLGHQFHKAGFRVHYLFYHSVLKTARQNARAVHSAIQDLDCKQLHIVAHSLGGLVTMHLLDQFRNIPPGKVVMLGSPVQGSGIARHIQNWPIAGSIIKQSLPQALSGKGIPDWPADRDWGMIAGTKNRGLGWLAGGLTGPGDGTVMLSETVHLAQSDHISLPVSHTGMIFSREVARQSIFFLNHGHFDRFVT